MTEKEFVSHWYEIISGEGIKNFPLDFLTTDNLTQLPLPQKALVIGSELFGKYEITSIDGIPVLQADDYIQAKYILYANRLKPDSISIPVDSESIKKTVTEYEEYLDSLIKKIENDFKKKFFDSPDIYNVINLILSKLNLTRL